ncbi:MAG: hypothetical protein OXB88_10575 [Bacteriovoracales bacterium]|nr:hypothetical protein [Bacteriovoracales bacterium]
MKMILFFTLTLSQAAFGMDVTKNPEGPGNYRTPDQRSGEYQRPLSDQERIEALEFEHPGLFKRIREKECSKSKERERVCRGEKAHAFGESEDELLKTAAQMASMILGPAGGSFSARKKKTTGESSDKKMTDFCAYIPMLGTVWAKGMQQREQRVIREGLSAKNLSQKEIFYKQAATHRARSKTAVKEAQGWTLATACYATVIATKFGFTNANNMTYVKMGGSAFLAYFYNRLKGNHDKYADIVKEIGDALPGKGDCNPITERDCYCAQIETVKDTKYCLPVNDPRPTLPPGMASVDCVDSKMQLDPSCDCTSSGTCADQSFNQLFNYPEFASSTIPGRLLSDFKNLANGRLNPNLLGGSFLGQRAFKRALDMADKNIDSDDRPLSEEQKKRASVLMKAGIPKRLAAQMSKLSPFPGADSFLARFKSPGKSKRKGTRVKPSPRIAVKDPFRKKARSSNRSNDPLAFLKKKKGRGPQNNDDIIRFAQKAQNKAGVSWKKEGNVFEQISHRYQNSGWERLEFDMP